MTMLNIPGDLGYGGSHLNRSVLREILVELQEKVLQLEGNQADLQTTAGTLQTDVDNLETDVGALISADELESTVVSGAAINTDIAVTGIETGDALVGVVKLDFTLTEGTPNTRTWDAEDMLSEASITSDGNIQLSATDTTGTVLIVTFLSRGG